MFSQIHMAGTSGLVSGPSIAVCGKFYSSDVGTFNKSMSAFLARILIRNFTVDLKIPEGHTKH